MTSRLFSNVLDVATLGRFPRTQKWVWRRIYNMLSRFWGDKDWRFMNYGYVPDGAPFALKPEDEAERAFIGLYQQAVEGLAVEGARVLEIGSGRGGGSRYIARYFAPASVTGLDYSPETVRRAPKRSATAPANGCAKPQIRFCRAVAKANTSRPHPKSALIGARNKPKPCRMPSDNAKISDAPNKIHTLLRHTELIHGPRGRLRPTI